MKLKNYLPYLLLLLVALPLNALAQQVTGKVIDSNSGEPLIGVTLKLEGSNTVAQTDAKGQFALKTNKKHPLTIIVSYTGYQKQEFYH